MVTSNNLGRVDTSKACKKNCQKYIADASTKYTVLVMTIIFISHLF